MLTSLEIKNFRAFSHLVIERLGRVNLIVGKNNVGKTTLLEALQICGSTSVPSTIRSILEARSEVRSSADLTPAGESRPKFVISSLFHGRDVWPNNEASIGVRAVDADIYEWLFETQIVDQTGDRCLTVDLNPIGRRSVFFSDGSAKTADNLPEEWSFLPVNPPILLGEISNQETESLVATWWDATWLSDGKVPVLNLLKSLAPVRDVIFVRDPFDSTMRIARVQTENFKDPIPLASMGGGATRLFHIALAMEFARHRVSRIEEAPEGPGPRLSLGSRDLYSFVLIDEVDTGIHHTMHRDLWRFIFQAARSLDVQIFATTHSLDCLRGFAEAAAEDEEADAQVIRPERVEGENQTGAVVIDREGLPIVIRDSIEVR